jgi:hypothetical protein
MAQPHKIYLTMNTQEQPNPSTPNPDLQIPVGYVILKLSGRDYIVPEFLTRSTSHVVESVRITEYADIYGKSSSVSSFLSFENCVSFIRIRILGL